MDREATCEEILLTQCESVIDRWGGTSMPKLRTSVRRNGEVGLVVFFIIKKKYEMEKERKKKKRLESTGAEQ